MGADAEAGEAPVDVLLEEEVKLGCTHTMLTCLDARLRERLGGIVP